MVVVAIDAGSVVLDVLPNTKLFASKLAAETRGGAILASATKVGLAAGAALAAGLVAVGVAAFKVGDTFDKAFDTIRVGTGATGKALEGLQGDFRKVVGSVPTDFGSASTAVADLNTRLGLTGKPLQDVSKRMLEMSRITETDLSANIESTSRVFGDWGIAVGDQAGHLDKLFVASQATGISVDKLSRQLVQYGAPLRQLGFDFDTSAALLGKFEKEGVNAELVMGSLRIALGKMARDGEPAEETLSRVVDQIKNAGSTSEANALALELFGARAGPDMAAAIREGRFEVDDLIKTIGSGEETILGAAEDTRDWRESWQLLVNNGMLLFEPVATRVFGAVSDFMAWLVDVGVPAMQDFGEVWGPRFAAAFAAVEPIIDAVIDAARRVVEWFSGDGEVVKGAEGMAAQFAPIWDQIVDVVTSAVDAIVAVVSVFVKLVTGIWDRFGKGILTGATRLWKDILQVISGVLDVILGVFEVFAGVFTGDWSRAWGGVQKIVAGVWRAIQGVIKGAIEIVRTLIGVGLAQIQSLWSGLWGQIRKAASSVWEGIKSTVRDAVNAVRESISSGLVAARDRMRDVLESMKTAVRNKIDDIIDFFRRLPDRIVSALKSLGSKVKTAITDALSGIKIDLPFNLGFSGDGPGRGAGGTALATVQAAMRSIPGLAVTSTYRSPSHNARVGGSPTSYHLDRNNPAVDVVGPASSLDRLYAVLRAVGGRELIWRAPGHYDHLHYAHAGGVVDASWPTLPGLRPDERPGILQVGETITARGEGVHVTVLVDGQEIRRVLKIDRQTARAA